MRRNPDFRWSVGFIDNAAVDRTTGPASGWPESLTAILNFFCEVEYGRTARVTFFRQERGIPWQHLAIREVSCYDIVGELFPESRDSRQKAGGTFVRSSFSSFQT